MHLTAQSYRRRLKQLPEDLALLARLKSFTEELAAEPCSYGDNCPPPDAKIRSSWHGRCVHCQARTALGVDDAG